MRINAALLNFIRDFIFIYAVWFINMESRDAFGDQCTKCGSNDNDDDAKKYVRAMIFCHTCERGYHFKCTGLPGSFKAWHRKRDSIFICDECEENAEWKDKEKFISSVMIAGGTESKYVKTIIEHMVKILKPSMSEPISSSNNEHDTQQVVSSISEEDPGVKYLYEKFQQIMALPATFVDCKSSIQCSMDAVMHRASKWEITLKCPFDGCDKDFTDMKKRSCLKSHYKYNHNGIEKYPIEYMRYCTTQYYCNQMMSVFKEIKNDYLYYYYYVTITDILDDSVTNSRVKKLWPVGMF